MIYIPSRDHMNQTYSYVDRVFPQLLLRPRPPQIIFAGRHDWVYWWILLANTSLDRSEHRASAEPPEEWGRVSLSTTLVDDTVYGTDEKVIRLSHETVGDVDNKGPRDGLDVDPLSRLGENLQPFLLLGDDCEALHISVSTNAILVVPRSLLLGVM